MHDWVFALSEIIAPLGLWRDDRPVPDPFSTTLSGQRALLTNDAGVTASFFDDDAAGPTVDTTIQRYTARTATASLVWPIPEFGLEERIHRVSCPVTLIWGSDDRTIDPIYADLFADHLTDLRARNVIAGA